MGLTPLSLITYRFIVCKSSLSRINHLVNRNAFLKGKKFSHEKRRVPTTARALVSSNLFC